MDIIKEAVLRIDRDSTRRTEEPAGKPVPASSRRLADEPSLQQALAPEELADCEALAGEWGLNWETVETDELDDPEDRTARGEP